LPTIVPEHRVAGYDLTSGFFDDMGACIEKIEGSIPH
jgi:hypothetical protein